MRVADQFPVGMRVLAVDDDPACLRLLGTLLRRCQYDVTVTDRATIALKLLRENKDQFDLVISDVHMPDMDGFKLLELVGLEMDLPVIMLSADGETKTVMKGVTHGAVDYLLKPVRIEELRNIWQHAMRRRNVEKGCTKYRNADSVDGQEPGQLTGNLSRKRKDPAEDDDDNCCEEGMHESEDPSAQKRARVVWSIELHRKFVAAVNRLGLDKAVPKRILDLMDVEGITRENVASHLQKYRLYLKRLSGVARQQASMVAALGGRDLPYLPMYSVDGLGDFQGLAASYYTPALSSYPQNGALNLTIPTTLGMQGLSHSGMVHFGDSHDTTNPTVFNLHKLQYSSPPGNLLHGGPMPLEPVNFQQQKTMPVNSHLPITLSRGPDSSMSMMRSYACPIALKNSLNSSVVDDPTVVRDGQCQVNSGDTKFVNIRSTCNSRQKWEEQKGSHASEPSLLSGSSLNCPLSKHPLLDPLAENKRFNNGLCRIKTDTSMIGSNNISAPFLAQSFKPDKSTFDGHLNYKDEFSFETMKMMGGLTPNNCNFDDFVKAIIKPEHDVVTFIDGGDMGYDIFPLGTCM